MRTKHLLVNTLERPETVLISHHMTPAQFYRHCRRNLCAGESLRKLEHPAQIADFKTPAKLLRELLAQLLQQLATVLGTFAAKHSGSRQSAVIFSLIRGAIG